MGDTTFSVDGGFYDAPTPPENTVIEYFPALPVSIFADNFDAAPVLPAGWTTGSNPTDTGTTSWEFGTPSGVGPGAAGSTPNCAPTNLSGIYGVDSDIYLRTPAIDLTTASGATLNFDPQALAEWHLDNAIATIP